MAETLNVNLGVRSYALRFGSDLAADVRSAVDKLLHSGRRVAVLTDRNIAGAQAQSLQAMFADAPTLAIEAGENSKSMAGLGETFDFLAAHHIDRSGALFAVGGGVVGDL